ncbi:MAG: CapA family protein, partial [Sulfuricella sp.]|nr:CapA family protein [Sulfuricella sp.]
MKTTGPALLLATLLLIAVAVQADPVRLIFAGDIMLDDGPGRVIQSGRDPLAHFSATLAEADFTLGNLECPVATGGKALESKI